ELELLLDVETGQIGVDRKAISARSEDRYLRGGRRRGAHGGVHQYPVRPDLLESNRIEMHGDIGVQVARALDLVDELGGDGIHGDRALVRAVFGDDAGSVGGDFGEGEAGSDESREGGE